MVENYHLDTQSFRAVDTIANKVAISIATGQVQVRDEIKWANCVEVVNLVAGLAR